jgi:hypothetical protein
MSKPDSSLHFNNWHIDFKGNVHMYAHRLVLTHEDQVYDVACEDTPDGYTGIWLYETGMDPEIAAEARACLPNGRADMATRAGYLSASPFTSPVP